MIRVCVLLIVVFTAGASAQDAATLYRQGVDEQRQGNLTGAAESYKRSLEIDGTNVAARSNRGAALAGLGRYDEAIVEYQQALKGAPEQVRPYLERNLALAWYKSGRLEQAAPLLVQLHNAQPNDREIALLAADCLLQLGEPDKAQALLEPMAANAGNDKALAYALGMAYLKSGRTADAQRVLDPILKDEASPEGRYALGMAMFTSGDYPAAVRAFGRAIELNPNLPHVQSYYGQALVFTGDPDGALAAFAKQLSADTNDFDANFQSAQILSRRGKYAEAEALLKRAVLLRPKSGSAHLALAETFVREAKETEARKELELTVREWPQAGAAHAELARIYAKSGMKAEAAREQTLGTKYAVTAEIAKAGLKDGSIAPKFRLAKSDSTGFIDITSPEKGRPTVLVFGSYSCPNFRKASPVLNELAQSLGKQISFLQVYIREAHANDQWESTINERENVQLAPVDSMGKKSEYAAMCTRKLHLRFPAVVDGLNDAAEKAYDSWPSRVYVLTADGKVRYSSALIEEEFDRAALEAAIRSVVPGAARAPVVSRR